MGPAILHFSDRGTNLYSVLGIRLTSGYTEGQGLVFLLNNLTSIVRPHVTREKAVSCQITFKLYRFFSQFVANSSKASLSCYIYCDLWQLMVILRIVYVIYCVFAIVCDIYCDLWQICNNFKFFSWFCFLPFFSLVTWGLRMHQISPK